MSWAAGRAPRDPQGMMCGGPAHRRRWLRGERGWAKVEILPTPEPEPRIQTLRVTAVGDPSEALTSTAERLLAAAGEPEPGWPADLPRVAMDAASGEVTAVELRIAAVEPDAEGW